MELIFVRHGRPEHVQTSDGSPADPPLAEVGHLQATAVAQWLSEESVDHIYSSPMRRALETARPIEKALGLTAVIREHLSEFDRNSSSYVPMEILKEVNRQAWERMAAGAVTSSGDSIHAWRHSVIREVEELIKEHSGQRVVVVCHGGVINAYIASCLSIDENNFMKFDVDYSSVSRVLASGAGHRSIKSVNETTHFRGQPHLSVRD